MKETHCKERMSRSLHTEGQRITAVRQVLAGQTVATVAAEHGIGEPAIYRWKKTYRSMIESGDEEMMELRRDNARLERLVDDLILNRDILLRELQKCSMGMW
jgi:putative transposase